MNTITYTCKICHAEFLGKRIDKLKKHITKDHSLVWEEYLREYHPELGGYCLECGKPTTFINFNKGFLEFCSNECVNKSSIIQDRIKAKKLERYGSETYNNTKKNHETNKKNHDGVLSNGREKANNTCLERYGCENPSQVQEIKDKKVKTCLEHFGVENPTQATYVKEKSKKTKLEKYGSETYNNRDQAKDTCITRYGCTTPLQNKDVQEKAKQTCLDRYGVEYPSQSIEIKEKVKQTNNILYGTDYNFQNENVKTRIKETNLKIYGCITPLQNKEIQEKIKRTNLERYGVENPFQNKDIILQLKRNFRSKRYNLFKSQILKFKNIELLDTKEEYISNETHRYSCSVHGEFESTGTNCQQVFCSECYSGFYGISSLEKEVAEFLSIHIDLETSNRTILSPLELDILIPSKNLAIEFDGLYWHSNVYKEKNYHLEKTLGCQAKDIQLIHIFENEWLHKRPVVESILLAKLGIFQKRLFARKCEVKIVSQETYREFTELNHLQGYVPAKLILGLFYEDELVEICSFGKSRFKSGENELLRHCSLLNTQIIGGFSKLIKAWKKLNPEETLYTYCDRRYSNGSSYEKSGWTKVSESAPNYFYIVAGQLESRMKYQKHKLDKILNNYDETLTEQENMSVNGFSWIYDCGNLKFEI